MLVFWIGGRLREVAAHGFSTVLDKIRTLSPYHCGLGRFHWPASITLIIQVILFDHVQT